MGGERAARSLGAMKRLGTLDHGASAGSALAPAATAAKRQRPDAVPATAEAAAPNAIQVFNDYVTPARTYSSRARGRALRVARRSAPPLNDDDADGVPDYVERVGARGRHGHRLLRAARLRERPRGRRRPGRAAGHLHLALRGRLLRRRLPRGRRRGRRLPRRVELARPEPDGEPRQPRRHRRARALPPRPVLVLPRRRAAARRTGCSRARPRRWRRGSSRRSRTSSRRCSSGTGSPRRSSRSRRRATARSCSGTTSTSGSRALLPAYLARDRPSPGSARRRRWRRRTSGSRTGRSPARSAATPPGSLAQYGDRLQHLPELSRARSASVAPLAIHFVRLSPRTRSLTLRFTRGRGEAVLSYAVASPRAGEPSVERRLAARTVGGTFTFRIPAALRASDRYERPTLVVANGGTAGAVRYRASAA